jgi:glycosyltransferase involved in cell wall biosynthesis
MKHKLSIIIPCYNCTPTLEEALASVYTQNLTIPFEVVMVDDGSTDKTLEHVVDLSKKYPHVTYYVHAKNRGGGAARNTGIAKSTGDLVYCLDSDNIFAPNTLKKMIDYLDEKKCDAVAFSERRFFINKNKNKYNAQLYKILDRPISLEDMFGKEPPLLDNFLYTKKSYSETSGYPENHGFDTQCFELRYLSSGHSVYFCPGTSCYHRQGANDKSYFERVYESGEFSKNMYLVYEDIFFLFSPVVRQKIIDYDIFKNSSMGALDGIMRELFNKDKENFFIKNYHFYVRPNGFDAYVSENKDSRETTDLFCFGIYYYKQGRNDEALEYCKKLAARGEDTKITYYNILRIITAMAHPSKKVEAEKRVADLIESIQAKRQEIDLNPSIIKRIKIKVRSVF